MAIKINCKKCNCYIFVVKSLSKKPNKNGDYTCFLYCNKCNKKLILKKGLEIKLIK